MGNLIDHGPWESPASSDSSSCVMKRFGFRKWPATAMAFMKAARRARSLPVQEDGSLCFTEWLTYDWKEARFGVPLLQPTAEHRISRITCIKSHSISQLRYSIISSSHRCHHRHYLSLPPSRNRWSCWLFFPMFSAAPGTKRLDLCKNLGCQQRRKGFIGLWVPGH